MADLTELLATGLGTAFVVEVAAKTVVLLAVTAVLVRLARRGSAATRHAIWIVGLAAIAVIPIASTLLPDVALPVLAGTPAEFAPPAATSAAQAAVGARDVDPVSITPLETRDERAEHGVAAETSGPLSTPAGPGLIGWVFVIWWGGAVVAILRLVVARAQVGLLTRQSSRPAPRRAQVLAARLTRRLGLRRRVRVFESSWFTVPATWGAVRPVVLLPAGSATWDAERLRVVLLHELAHVRRWDYLTNLLSELACAIHWPNPFVWLAARRAHREQEQACDDTVLRFGTQSVEYATHLVEIARALTPLQAGVPGALAMAAPSTLMGRVRAILAPGSNREPTARRTLSVTVLAATILVLPLASANVLGSSYRVRTMRGLAQDLMSEAPAARARAAWALGGYASEETVAALVTGLHDPVAEVRGAAALSLGKVGRSEGMEPLLRALKDADPFVRENAVLALYRYKDRRAQQAVIGMTRDEQAGVRSVTVWGLGQIATDAAADALAYVIEHDPDEHTRSMAMSALVDMEGNVSLPRLLNALGRGKADTRANAAYALASLGDKRAIEPLVEVMLTDDEDDVRIAAARAVARMADERALDGLLRALDDSVRQVREAAVRALGKLDSPRAEAGVLKALRDPVHQVRLTAVWVLQGVYD